jgi:tRNA wybutosine-synthesizing protein 3
VQSLESPDPSLAGATPTRLSRNARRGAFAGKVRRMHRPTRAGFADGPASAREPCVLTGLDLGPAPWTWSPEHLASKPGVASAEVSVHVSASPHLDFVRKNFAFENLAFGEFLNRLRDEGTGTGTGPADAKTNENENENENENASRSWYYLRSIGSNPRKEPAHALAQFPELAEELRVPGDVLWGASVPAARLAEDARYFSAVLRCSSGGTRLWTHYDAMDNALIQLHGEKRVLLFPPRVSAGLYLEGSSSPVVGPEVDGDASLRLGTENGDKRSSDEKKTVRQNAFPAYRAARRAAMEVVLQPGDVLFIPALWAHHTEALHGPSVAVNVFWRELQKTAYPQKDLYGNADPLAAGEALRLVDAAAKTLANSPRDHKVFYGGLAASRLLRDLRVERDVASTFAAFGAESDAENTCAEISGNELLFPSKVAEDVRTGRHDLRDGAETSLTALGVWFAPPARWADAVKGAALGIGAFVAWRRLYGSSGGS